jgi:hypothetical protein
VVGATVHVFDAKRRVEMSDYGDKEKEREGMDEGGHT